MGLCICICVSVCVCVCFLLIASDGDLCPGRCQEKVGQPQDPRLFLEPPRRKAHRLPHGDASSPELQGVGEKGLSLCAAGGHERLPRADKQLLLGWPPSLSRRCGGATVAEEGRRGDMKRGAAVPRGATAALSLSQGQPVPLFLYSFFTVSEASVSSWQKLFGCEYSAFHLLPVSSSSTVGAGC